MSGVTRVKICGITRLEDAELAAEPRRVGDRLRPVARVAARGATPRGRPGIAPALRRRVELVGVFVNPTLDEVAAAAEAPAPHALQLHGDEGPAFCAEGAAAPARR